MVMDPASGSHFVLEITLHDKRSSVRARGEHGFPRCAGEGGKVDFRQNSAGSLCGDRLFVSRGVGGDTYVTKSSRCCRGGLCRLVPARALADSSEADVTLVDRHPYQLFAPLLYQVATGGLPEDDIAYPVRAAIPGITFVRGEVAKVDVEDGSLRLNSGAEISWDRLVLATGSIGNSFGIPGVDEHALQMKDIRQARAIKNRLLGTYERVQQGEQPREDLQVVVVGGGPTGVEVAGAVAELQKQMAHEFPTIAEHAHVTLIEAGPRLLPSFSERSSERAQQSLTKLGVDVILDSAVDRMYPSDIHLKSGRIVSAGTTIWAAGVAADQQWTSLGDSDRPNRLVVDENLQCVRTSGSSATWRIPKTTTVSRCRWWRPSLCSRGGTSQA